MFAGIMKHIKLYVTLLCMAAIGTIFVMGKVNNKQQRLFNLLQYNHLELENVAKYVANIDANVAIKWNTDKADVIHGIVDGRSVELNIENENIQTYIQKLFVKHKCQRIYKCNQKIFFQFFSDLDHGCGLMYSPTLPEWSFNYDGSAYSISETPFRDFFYYQAGRQGNG